MKMPDEIVANYDELAWYEPNYEGAGYWTEYIRKDIHEEKMEVLRRIISGLEADIKKLKGK